ncbi:hypothetical protein [Okeania sp. SIO3I5]|uniref:hypothetical protein n=1 Tax=Okeania sp. SIO3I5 TaxID=2607805 RepID=UPI0025FCA8F1|nr:hypothetical protein [Okeania sp. SIO3I5]
MPVGKRQNELTQAAQLMFAEDFGGRVLPFDETAAIAFGEITAKRRRKFGFIHNYFIEKNDYQDLRNIRKYRPSVGANGIRPPRNSLLYKNLPKS